MKIKKDINKIIKVDSEQGQEMLQFAIENGLNIPDEASLLEDCSSIWVKVRKRPMLTMVLGSSVLSEKHLDDLESLLSDQSFEDLDCLIQVVAGDLEIAAEMVSLIRSKVNSKLTGIVPAVVTGPGCILGLGMDEIIGGETTSFGPLDIPTMHIAIFTYLEQTGEFPPMYNEDIYKEIYINAKESAKTVLDENTKIFNGESDKIINHLIYVKGIDALQAFNLKTLKKMGLNARFYKQNENEAFNYLGVVVSQLMSNRIQIIQ